MAGRAVNWIKSSKGQKIIGGTIGIGVAIAVAPAVLSAVGFTSAGIAASSVATWGMSLYAGATPAAGIIATCQTIGATGTVLGSPVATAVTGSVGAVVGAVGPASARGLAAACRSAGPAMGRVIRKQWGKK